MEDKQARIWEEIQMVAKWVQEGKYGTGDELDGEWLQKDLEEMTDDIGSILED